jgi:transcriptional regulator with XRE-family HTH domain
MTIGSIDARIGARVKALRERKSVSADAMAQATNLSLSEYFVRESGAASFTAGELWAVANTLRVSFEEIFRGIVSTSDELSKKRN